MTKDFDQPFDIAPLIKCPNLNKTTKGRFLRHPVKIIKVVMEPQNYENR